MLLLCTSLKECIGNLSEIWYILIFKDGAARRIATQFQCVTWKLEKALSSIPYDQFDISEEVQEQVGVENL